MGRGVDIKRNIHLERQTCLRTPPDPLGFLVLKPGGLLPFPKSESSKYGPMALLNKRFNALDSLEFSFEVCVCEQK